MKFDKLENGIERSYIFSFFRQKWFHFFFMLLCFDFLLRLSGFGLLQFSKWLHNVWCEFEFWIDFKFSAGGVNNQDWERSISVVLRDWERQKIDKTKPLKLRKLQIKIWKVDWGFWRVWASFGVHKCNFGACTGTHSKTTLFDYNENASDAECITLYHRKWRMKLKWEKKTRSNNMYTKITKNVNQERKITDQNTTRNRRYNIDWLEKRT